jgi:hypothetical protein
MSDISYEYGIPEVTHAGRGFTQTLRDMCRGGSVEIPLAKKASVYSAARAAGVKVRLRTTDQNTVRVWRVDGPDAPKSIFADGLNIFGEPIQKPAPSVPPVEPTPMPKPKPKRPGYYQTNKWSPRVWVDDLNVVTVTEDTIFS